MQQSSDIGPSQRVQSGLVRTVPNIRCDQQWVEAAETRPAILAALRRALELAGVEFIDENGGGLGVRYRKRQRSKPTR